jgi:hypothetical protein
MAPQAITAPTFHEVDVLGFLLSPLLVFVAIAVGCTLAIGLVADRCIPYSFKRHEGLVGLLTFVVILALCMQHAF